MEKENNRKQEAPKTEEEMLMNRVNQTFDEMVEDVKNIFTDKKDSQ